MFCAADFWIAKPPFPAGKISAKPYRKTVSASRSNPAREHWHNFIKAGVFRLRARKIAGIFHRIYGLNFKKIISNFLARIKFRIKGGARKKPNGESERCQNDNAWIFPVHKPELILAYSPENENILGCINLVEIFEQSRVDFGPVVQIFPNGVASLHDNPARVFLGFSKRLIPIRLI